MKTSCGRAVPRSGQVWFVTVRTSRIVNAIQKCSGLTFGLIYSSGWAAGLEHFAASANLYIMLFARTMRLESVWPYHITT